jgi:twitching motility protein PilT
MPFVDLSNQPAQPAPASDPSMSAPVAPVVGAQPMADNSLPALDSAPQVGDVGAVPDPSQLAPAPAATDGLPALDAGAMPVVEPAVPSPAPAASPEPAPVMPSPAPAPEAAPAATETSTDLPVGELNSLNIPAAATQESSLTAPAQPSAVGLEIDESGVKTITGPELAAPAPTPEAAPAELKPEATAEAPAPVAESTSTALSATEAPATPTPAALSPEPALSTPAPAEAGVAAKTNSGGENMMPADTKMDVYLQMAEERKASDIHFAANYPVMLRVDGKLTEVSQPLSPAQSKDLALQLLKEEQKDFYLKEKEIDFSFTSSKNTRFRVNLFHDRDNSAGALRLIAKNIRTMKELDLPEVFNQLVDEPFGLILLVGPTGSGKSTTLAAMLNHINMNRAEHILTVEDPIEYVYPIGKSIVNQRELNADTKSWNNALKSALREDPNIVLVGEMRDLDTIESTITIAETGHLTFATLHTNSASQAVDRIIDVFPEGSKDQIRAQLANVLTAVVSQRLIPVQTGGRRAALEVMLGTVAVRNAIREGKTYQIDNIIQTSGDLGMITLEKSLVGMVKKGFISREVAKSYSAKPDEIDSLMNKI